MAWSNLLANQMVSYTDAQSGGFTLLPGQSNVVSNQCMTKAQALSKYNLNASDMNAYESNQLIPKSLWNTPIVFDPFDHMAVRFTYTKPLDGRDLDIMVYYDGTGTVYDQDAVGYGQSPNEIKLPSDATPDADAYLWWASDDVTAPDGECVEAVVIGINKFNTDLTTNGSDINIYLRVGWFEEIGLQKIVDIELKTYLGGTMSIVGTNIINTGGTLVNNSPKSYTVTAGTGQVTLENSNLVGVITYNKANKTAVLT